MKVEDLLLGSLPSQPQQPPAPPPRPGVPARGGCACWGVWGLGFRVEQKGLESRVQVEVRGIRM